MRRRFWEVARWVWSLSQVVNKALIISRVSLSRQGSLATMLTPALFQFMPPYTTGT